MSGRSSYKRKTKKRTGRSSIIIAVIIIIAAFSLFLASCDGELLDMVGGLGSDGTSNEDTPVIENNGEEVSFHVIDIGQGDAILITTPSGNMLIDSGDLGKTPREQLTKYLEKHNIEDFEYVIFTHTDADHIGSADYVIENYNVKNIIMPDYEATTKVFERLISAIETRNVNLILIGEDRDVCEQSGYTFYLGPVLNTVMGPTKDFKDANEMSVVVKSVYGDTSILFTGDAEHRSEEAMLEMYKNGQLDCDILKVGHHGSNTSTTDEFLDAVSPEIAVISCGEGNKFGHPHKETTDKLREEEIHVFRTDINGSVVIKTDGKTYTVTAEK